MFLLISRLFRETFFFQNLKHSIKRIAVFTSFFSVPFSIFCWCAKRQFRNFTEVVKTLFWRKLFESFLLKVFSLVPQAIFCSYCSAKVFENSTFKIVSTSVSKNYKTLFVDPLIFHLGEEPEITFNLLWKRWSQKNPLCSISTFQKCFADQQAKYQTDLKKFFEWSFYFSPSRQFRKKSIFSQNLNTH